ncbi:unnamed protein product [Brassica oleracea var. botrytis]
MHPPDLNMLETNSGLRGSDGSFSGKAQATSSNSTLAINAAIGLNFEATEVGGSKDSRAAADGVCGVNLEAENIRQQSCGEQILVQQGKNKQANVEAASGDDIGNVAGCAVMDVDKRKGNDYDIGEDEDEDDGDYDYNY